MKKSNPRIEAARSAYRQALDAARVAPTPQAWARLLAAGRALSAAESPPPRPRRGRGAGPRLDDVIDKLSGLE